MPDPAATSTSASSSDNDKQQDSLPELPDNFAGAQAQALTAVQAALKAGYKRLQVEILAPDLKPDALAYPFHQVFDAPFGFAFADAGAAALAKYRWEQPDWMVCGIREAGQIDDPTPLIVSMPTLVEIEAVEQLCDRRNSNVSTDKSTDIPVVVINPILQDTGMAGVGLSGRRLRERFMSTLEPCYFLQSLGSGALFRMFPHPWTVWELTDAGHYQVIATLDAKPSGEQLAQLFAGNEPESIWSGLKRFIRALQN